MIQDFKTSIMFLRSLLTTVKKVLPERPFTIAVEGNIGSGKTTFLNHIEKLGNVSVVSEPVEKWRNCSGHNLLSLLYQDPKKYGFTFQSYVQLTLLENHSKHTSHPVKLMERSIYSGRYCFVEKLMRDGVITHPEFSVLDEWFKWICRNRDVGVDLFVYLRTEPKVVYERILQRNRVEEKKIPFEHIQSLHQLHEEWLNDKNSQRLPARVFTIDANFDLGLIGSEYDKFEDQVLNKKGLSFGL